MRDHEIKTVTEFVTRNTGMQYSDLVDGSRIGERNHYIDSFSKALLNEIMNRTVLNVVGDYDVDGVTSLSIWKLLMQHIDKNYPVQYVIPLRFTDGYGINKRIVEGFTEGIVLTFDNGISAKEALDEARAKGLKVFLTDHHPLPEGAVVPETDAVVDLNVKGEGFCGYCGAGIAYNIALYIIENYPWSEEQKKGLPWLLETLRSFAAIGTIADVMELKDQNREIVKAGLKGMVKKGRTSGLFALLEALKKQDRVTSDDIGYYVGPCLNAPGRLYDNGAMKAFELLTFNGDYTVAAAMAADLLKDNEQRKQLTEIHFQRTLRKITEAGREEVYPVVEYIPDLPLGICGIIAGKVAERFHAPAIIITNVPGKEFLSGSGRTFGDIHLKHLLDESRDLMVAYGGHAGAAGIKIMPDMVDSLREKLQSLIKRPDETNYLWYDIEIGMDDIGTVTQELKYFEPFGEGNPAPTFKIRDFLPKPVKDSYFFTFSKMPDGIKIFGKNISAISFDLKPKFTNSQGTVEIPGSLEILGNFNENYYMGNVTWQITMQDVKFERKEDAPASSLRSRLLQMAKER